jgi:hypothetical protein
MHVLRHLACSRLSPEFFPSVAALQGTCSDTEERQERIKKDEVGDELKQAITSVRYLIRL